jgi:hypothetical protein
MRLLSLTCIGAIGAFGWLVWDGMAPSAQQDFIESALEDPSSLGDVASRELDAHIDRQTAVVVRTATDVGEDVIDATVAAVQETVADAAERAAIDAKTSLRESVEEAL